MKKKNIIIIIIVLLVAILCIIGGLGTYKYFTVDGSPLQIHTKTIPLMEFDKFKEIDLDTTESVKIIKYTEGGGDEQTITDKTEIKDLYNRLSNIKVGKETNMACEDNTTVYSFNRKDGKSIAIEIECDWLVIEGKRYLIK